MATKKIPSLTLTAGGMPNGDDGARWWLKNFANQLAEMPTVRQAVGVTDEQSRNITELVDAFAAALTKSNDAGTRTSPNIEAKTLARNAAVIAVREIVKAIKDHPDVSNAQRASMGFHPRHTAEYKREQQRRRDRRFGFLPRRDR